MNKEKRKSSCDAALIYFLIMFVVYVVLFVTRKDKPRGASEPQLIEDPLEFTPYINPLYAYVRDLQETSTDDNSAEDSTATDEDGNPIVTEV